MKLHESYVETEKKYIIYPNNHYYQFWDLFMIFILVCSCFLIPYEIAFPDNKDGSRDMVKMVLDKIFDVFFFIDVILTFYSAVITEDYNIIDDRKEIAINYLKGWFTLDILSCIPYGEIGAALLSEKQMVHL